MTKIIKSLMQVKPATFPLRKLYVAFKVHCVESCIWIHSSNCCIFGDRLSLRIDISVRSYGRLMIDPAAFKRIRPNNRVVPVVSKLISPSELTADQKLLLSPYSYGFSLGDKTWGEFSMAILAFHLHSYDIGQGRFMCKLFNPSIGMNQ